MESREAVLKKGELELEGKSHEQIFEIVQREMRIAMQSIITGEGVDVAKQLSKRLGVPIKLGSDPLNDRTVIVQVQMPVD